MGKIVCIGECIMDLLPLKAGGSEYVAKAGGAPANVAACVARLGGDGCYMGKLSEDGFSELIASKLVDAGVSLRYAVRDAAYPTAIALVTLTPDGDRSFTFYRKETADLMFSPEDVPDDFAKRGDILHFCSVGLVESPLKRAHEKAVRLARAAGAYVSFDVNLRPALYSSEAACVEAVNAFLPYADIVKVTDDELAILTGERDEVAGVGKLLRRAESAAVVFVTKGEKGATVHDREGGSVSVPAAKVKVADTTGAGDCFIGSVLFLVSRDGFGKRAEDYLPHLKFASAACGIVCSKKGAIESMPTYDEVMKNV